MRNTITLNGVESSTIPGLLIQELPAISKPLMRTEVETIDGRDGDITTDLGFSAYDKQISIGLFADYDIDQIIAYFNSKGTVIFSNEPDKFYNYEIVDQIDFERLVRYRTATVTMHCQPFKYSTTEAADILSTNSNFATLDQSINSDASNFSYSSNVQADVTATRTTTTGGGKFFATFTMNVVQGVTYYFSGNAANSCTMYGYKDRIWGTSAGFSGRKLPQFPSYTATYTGTLIIGFYSVTTEPVFIRNFKVSNQSASTVSGEGTNIVLENSAEAPFSRFDLKGNTEQITFTGKNKINLAATASATVRISGYSFDSNTNTFTITHNGADQTHQGYAGFNIAGLTVGQTYNVSVGEITGATEGDRVLLVESYNGSATSDVKVITYPNTSGSFTVPNDSTRIRVYLYVPVNSTATYKNVQLEAGSSTTTYEPFVGGTKSPNPDFSQDVMIATGENTINISGKNLLKLYQLGSASEGITSTVSNGVVHVSGVTTSDWFNITASGEVLVLPGTYCFSITEKLPFGIRLRLVWDGGGYTDYNIWSGGLSSTVTTTKKAVKAYVWASSISSGTTIDLTIKPQLELSSSASDFEPYSEQTYSLQLVNGTNLFDKNNPNILDAYIDNEHTSITANSYNRVVWIPCEPNTTYTLRKLPTSGVKQVAYTTVQPAVGVAVSQMESWPIRTAITTYTTGADASYLVIRIWQSTQDAGYTVQDLLNSLDVVKGTIPEMCNILSYSDNIYKSEDKWYLQKKIKKIVFNGSENWNSWYHVGDYIGFYLNDSSLAPLGVENTYNNALRSDKFSEAETKNSLDRGEVEGIKQCGLTSQQYIAIGVAKTRLTDYSSKNAAIASFKTWLSSNPVTVYAVLLNPVNTEITNENTKAQLEAINQANAYRHRTHINALAATGNVPHIIAAEVATDPSGTITNSGNIYSKPKLTIFGSGSVGVYLNGVQMFQIALGTNDYITIDTAIMEAYKDNLQTLKNRSVTGDYNNFKLPVGESEISFSGSVTMCVVENYSRWL